MREEERCRPEAQTQGAKTARERETPGANSPPSREEAGGPAAPQGAKEARSARPPRERRTSVFPQKRENLGEGEPGLPDQNETGGLAAPQGAVREIRPANVYDVAANETWLEDQAAQGWHLTGMTGWSGVFEKGKPKICRYRMQPVPQRKQVRPAEMIELYGSLGWQYVCTLQGLFYVWRSEDPGAPELDTDPVVQGMGYRYLRRRMLRDGIISLLLLAVLVGLWVWLSGLSGTPLLDTVTEWVPGRLLAGSVGAALILVLLVCQVSSMVRLLRTLRAGIPLKRPRPYRLQRWLARGLLACFVFILAAHFLGGLRNMSGNGLARGWDAGNSRGVPKEDVVYVDLACLEGAEITEFWGCRTKVQELCPRMYLTRQLSLGPVERELRPGDSLQVISSAETTYYRMLTEGLAAALEAELARERPSSFGSSGFVQGHPALAPVEAKELDGFWWGESTYYQFALARLGREVLLLQYEGDTDLRQKEAYLAELLA